MEKDFIPLYTGNNEYRYDNNGALIYDANQGIPNIEYDLRNNPRLIQFSDGSQTEYVYSALGEKLKTIHRTATLYSSSFDGNDTVVDGDPTSNPFPMPRLLSSGTAMQNTDTTTRQDMTATTILSIDSTEYIGSFIFENGRADKFLFPGGYYSFVSTSPLRLEGSEEVSSFYYYLTDHLGNNRVVINDNGDIEQTTHYYPFGAVYADAGKNPDFQKFKYTGKELDLVHGLNTYDHGARQNYSILGVWDRIDPMTEKYYNISPYAVSGDNPINIIDINGCEGVKYIDNDSNKHIDVNVVVLLKPIKQIPLNASEKKIKKIYKENRKIIRENNEIKEKIATSLNNKFNAKDVKNSSGEKVIFGFNVIGVESENYETTSAVSVRSIATKYGLKAKTPDRFVGSFGYGIALPIVFSQGSAGSSEGITVNPLVRVNYSKMSFENILGHEAAHTFGLQDDYSGSGIMASPPQELSPSDIDEIWNNAYEL